MTMCLLHWQVNDRSRRVVADVASELGRSKHCELRGHAVASSQIPEHPTPIAVG